MNQIIAIFSLTTIAFLWAWFWSPVLLKILQRFKCYKKEARTVSPDNRPTPIFNSLHKHKELCAPRMAGILIWLTMLFLAFLFFFLSELQPDTFFRDFNFLSRAQTWIPLFTLVSASLLGLADDLLVVLGFGQAAKGGGIKFRHRLLAVFLIGAVGAWWFYFKLGWDTVHVPFYGDMILGFWYIPFFILVMLTLFSGSVIDGEDGLAGGIFAIIFGAFAAIAFSRGQYDLAKFCGVLTGAITAFLWSNIPPAKFYMGETGILGLTTTLAVVSFLTNTVLLLPIIAFVIFLEIGSVVLQMASKKFRGGKKIFLVAPLHHHFEAKGWASYQVTMRFWLIGVISSVIGLIIFLINRS